MLITTKQDNMENSPAKQTPKQKANLPKEVVDAISAKSSSRQEERTKRIGIRQGERTRRVEARHSSPAKQTGETVNTAGQVIPTGIGDAAPNNAFNASVTPPQPNRAGAPPRNTANLNMGIGVDPNTSNFKNNQVSNNAALAGGGNVPGMQVPQTMAAKYGSIAKQNGKVEKVDAVTGGIKKSNDSYIKTAGAGRDNPYATFTAFDGSATKLPSVQQQVDKSNKQTTDQKTKKRLIKAVKSTK